MTTKYGVPDPRNSGDRVAVIQPKFQNNFFITFNIKDENETRRVNFSNNVVSCDIPKIEFSEIHTNTFWSHGYTYGRPRWSTINLVVRDDSRNESLKLLGKLIQRQRNTYFPTIDENGTGGFGRNHMFMMTINNVSGQYDYGFLDRWILRGCFITHADFGNVSYENDTEVKTINITIRFNYCEQEVFDLNLVTNPELRRKGKIDTSVTDKIRSDSKPSVVENVKNAVSDAVENVKNATKDFISNAGNKIRSVGNKIGL